MKTTFIYALKCPATDQIRYVGKSLNLQGRLRRHLFDARKGESCHRAAWIRSLLAQGRQPILEIIDEVPEEHWQQWEVAYIEFFREAGCALTNGTPGGDGALEHTLEMREKNRLAHLGRKHSVEACIKIGNSHRGKKRPVETGKRISAAKKGKGQPWSAIRRERYTLRKSEKKHNVISNITS